jgi:hypothetical protein
VYEAEASAAQPTLDEEEILQITLGLLLERHPALVSFEELAAEFPAQSIADAQLHDAVDELERLGLVHCLASFHFASWRAVRMNQLRG